MKLKDLKQQLVAQKYRAKVSEVASPSFEKQLSKVLRGTDPSKKKQPAAHDRERQRVISVLKIALQYLSEGSGSVVTPGDLFEGLERTTVFVTGLDADIGAHSENPQPDTVANDSRTRRSTTLSSDSGAASAASAPEQTGWESDPESEESESEDEDSKAEEGDELLVAGERSSWDVVLHTDAAAGDELDRVVSVTTGNGTRRSARSHTKVA